MYVDKIRTQHRDLSIKLVVGRLSTISYTLTFAVFTTISNNLNEMKWCVVFLALVVAVSAHGKQFKVFVSFSLRFIENLTYMSTYLLS